MGIRDKELVEACKEGKLGVVDKFLSTRRKSSVGLGRLRTRTNLSGLVDNSGYTLLHHASLHGHVDIVSRLIAYDVDLLPLRDKKRCTALHLACFSGHKDVVGVLLNHESARKIINAQGSDGNTALHFCAQFGHEQPAAMLLKYEADPTLTNNADETPLDLAARYGRAELVRLLLTACPSLMHQHTHMINKDAPLIKTTPLHIAARHGKSEVVSLLLDRGMPINFVTDSGTALHDAALFGRTPVVDLLLTRGVDPNIRNSDGQTVLDLLNDHQVQKTQEITELIRSRQQWADIASMIAVKNPDEPEDAPRPSSSPVPPDPNAPCTCPHGSATSSLPAIYANISPKAQRQQLWWKLPDAAVKTYRSDEQRRLQTNQSRDSGEPQQVELVKENCQATSHLHNPTRDIASPTSSVSVSTFMEPQHESTAESSPERTSVTIQSRDSAFKRVTPGVSPLQSPECPYAAAVGGYEFQPTAPKAGYDNVVTKPAPHLAYDNVGAPLIGYDNVPKTRGEHSHWTHKCGPNDAEATHDCGVLTDVAVEVQVEPADPAAPMDSNVSPRSDATATDSTLTDDMASLAMDVSLGSQYENVSAREDILTQIRNTLLEKEDSANQDRKKPVPPKRSKVPPAPLPKPKTQPTPTAIPLSNPGSFELTPVEHLNNAIDELRRAAEEVADLENAPLRTERSRSTECGELRPLATGRCSAAAVERRSTSIEQRSPPILIGGSDRRSPSVPHDGRSASSTGYSELRPSVSPFPLQSDAGSSAITCLTAPIATGDDQSMLGSMLSAAGATDPDPDTPDHPPPSPLLSESQICEKFMPFVKQRQLSGQSPSQSFETNTLTHQSISTEDTAIEVVNERGSSPKDGGCTVCGDDCVCSECSTCTAGNDDGREDSRDSLKRISLLSEEATAAVEPCSSGENSHSVTPTPPTRPAPPPPATSPPPPVATRPTPPPVTSRPPQLTKSVAFDETAMKRADDDKGETNLGYRESINLMVFDDDHDEDTIDLLPELGRQKRLSGMGQRPYASLDDTTDRSADLHSWLASNALLGFEPQLRRNGFERVEFYFILYQELHTLEAIGIPSEKVARFKLALSTLSIRPDGSLLVVNRPASSTVRQWLDDLGCSDDAGVFTEYMNVDALRRVDRVEWNRLLAAVPLLGHRQRLAWSLGLSGSEVQLVQRRTKGLSCSQSADEGGGHVEQGELRKSFCAFLLDFGKELLAEHQPTQSCSEDEVVPGTDYKWQHSRAELQRGVRYKEIQFLAPVKLTDESAAAVSDEAIRDIMKEKRRKAMTIKCIFVDMSISERAVQVLHSGEERQSKVAGSLVAEHLVSDIVHVCQDSADMTCFAYVAVLEKPRSSHKEYMVFVYRAPSKEIATQIILSIGQAFYVCCAAE